MRTYSTEAVISSAEEYNAIHLEDIMLYRKQRMANDLGNLLFEDLKHKPFTRDSRTGWLTLRYTITVVEDAELVRVRNAAFVSGMCTQRELEERTRPYGLDQEA